MPCMLLYRFPHTRCKEAIKILADVDQWGLGAETFSYHFDVLRRKLAHHHTAILAVVNLRHQE